MAIDTRNPGPLSLQAQLTRLLGDQQRSLKELIGKVVDLRIQQTRLASLEPRPGSDSSTTASGQNTATTTGSTTATPQTRPATATPAGATTPTNASVADADNSNAAKASANSPATTTNATEPANPAASRTPVDNLLLQLSADSARQLATRLAALQSQFPDLSRTLLNSSSRTLQNLPYRYQSQIQLAGRNLTLQTQLPLPPGSQLQVKVLAADRLQLLDNSERPAAKAAPNELLHTTLREILPQQQRPVALLRLLQLLPAMASDSVSQSVRNAVTRLLDNIVSSQELNAPALRQAIRNSGGFFEAKLAASLPASELPPATDRKTQTAYSGIASPQAGKPAVKSDLLPGSADSAGRSGATGLDADLKANLARLIQHLYSDLVQLIKPGLLPASLHEAGSVQASLVHQLLRLLQNPANLKKEPTRNPRADDASKQQLEMGKTLLRQSLSTLARIQYNQLSSLAVTSDNSGPEPGPNQQWVFDLPIKLGNDMTDFHCRISRDGQGANDSERAQQWKVLIGFELDNMGSLFVQLVLVNKQLAATLWAEQHGTYEALQSELDGLRQGFADIGVQIRQLDCYEGKPPDQTMRIEERLIDIHT